MKMKKMAIFLAAVMLFSVTAFAEDTEATNESDVYSSVRVASADPEMLSPLLLRRDGKNVVAEIFETLIDINGWGGETYGRLAKSWSWEPGDESDVLTVEIYDYIYDTDGNHYTTSDTAFCYQTCAEAGYLSEYEKYILEMNIVDDYTIQFICKPGTADTVRCDYDILGCCLQYTQAAYEASEDDMTTTPVGTGPYMLEEFESGSYAVTVRNDNYWQTEEELWPAQEANVDEIRWDFMTENTQKVNALTTGEIDYASGIEYDTLAPFEDNDDYHIISWAKNTVIFLMPNCDTGKPLEDLNLRAAIYYAIDDDDIIAALGGEECAIKTSAFATNDTVYYNPDWDTADTYYNVCDLDLAKEYLEKSSYDGSSLNIYYEANGDYGTQYETCALIVGAALDQLGIPYSISSLEKNSMTELWNYDSDSWDIIISAYGGAIGQVPEFWFQIYSGGQYDKDGLGLGNWHDDTLYEMFESLYTNSGLSQESVNEFYDYEVSNFYSYALCQPVNYDVAIKDIEDIYLTQRMWFLPGAFTYNVE